MKKFKILSGLWLFLLSPVFLCAQVTVNVTAPAQIGVCQENEFTMELELDPGETWPDELTIEYQISGGISSQLVSLSIQNIVPLNDVTGTPADNTILLEINQTYTGTTIEITYLVQFECSAVLDEFNPSYNPEIQDIELTETVMIDATEIWDEQYDVEYSLITGFERYTADDISLNVIGVQESEILVFTALYLGHNNMPVEINFNTTVLSCLGSIDNYTIEYAIDGINSVNDFAAWRNSVQIDVAGGGDAGLTWTVLTSWTQLNTLDEINGIVIRVKFNVLCLNPSYCTSISALLEWRCLNTISNCTEFTNSFALNDQRPPALIRVERIFPINALMPGECPGAAVPWRIRVLNDDAVSTRPVQTFQFVIGHDEGSLNEWRFLSVIDLASFQINMANCPGCAVEIVSQTSMTSHAEYYDTQNVIPLRRINIKISNIAPGEFVELDFNMVLAGQSSEFITWNSNNSYLLNKYHINPVPNNYIDYCGNNVSITMPGFNWQVGYKHSLSHQGYNTGFNLSIPTVINSVVSNLSVPSGAQHGGYGDIVAQTEDLMRLSAWAFFGETSNSLDGMLRAVVKCDSGLRIRECDFHRIAFSRFGVPSNNLELVAINFDPNTNESQCTEKEYEFYFKFPANATFAQMDDLFKNGRFKFRLTSCCSNPAPEDYFPEYFVRFDIMPNSPDCYSLTDYPAPIVFSENPCDNTPENVGQVAFDCPDCVWYGMSIASDQIALLCPGCLAPGVIVEDYSMTRLTYGLESTDALRRANGTGTMIVDYLNEDPLDNVYIEEKELNIHGSSYGDIIRDRINAYMFDGDSTNSPGDFCSSGYTLAQANALNPNKPLNVLQLDRNIPEGGVMDLTLLSLTLYIDVLDDINPDCCDCYHFYDGNIPDQRTVVKLVITGTDLNNFFQESTIGNDKRFLFSFNTGPGGNLSNLSNVYDCNNNLTNWDGQYRINDRYRLQCEYLVNGNFSGLNNTISENRRVADITNIMFLSGQQHDIANIDNLLPMPNDVMGIYLDFLNLQESDCDSTYSWSEFLNYDFEDFTSNFAFWCEAFGGRHYFYGTTILNPSLHQPVPQRLCAYNFGDDRDYCKQVVHFTSDLRLGRTLDDFPFEFKTPYLALDSVEFDFPADWVVDEVWITTKQHNINNPDVNKNNSFIYNVGGVSSGTIGDILTSTFGINGMCYNAVNMPTSCPGGTCLDAKWFFYDELSRYNIYFVLSPIDCESNDFSFTGASAPNMVITHYKPMSLACSMNNVLPSPLDLNMVKNLSGFETTTIRGLNPDFQVENIINEVPVSQSEVSWNVIFSNGGPQRAPMPYILVPQVICLQDFELIFNNLNVPSEIIELDGEDYALFMLGDLYDLGGNCMSLPLIQSVLSSFNAQVTSCECISDIISANEEWCLEYYFGWNCSEYPNDLNWSDLVCSVDTNTVCFNPAEIQLFPLSSSVIGDVSTCGSSFNVSFTYLNGPSSIYPDFGSIQLPTGLEVISAEILYVEENVAQSCVISTFVVGDFDFDECLSIISIDPTTTFTVNLEFIASCGFTGSMLEFDLGYDSYCSLNSEEGFLISRQINLLLNDDLCNPPCYICDDFSIDAQQIGCSFDFSAQVPYFEDCTYSTVHWNFGDGNTAFGNFAQHTYIIPGNYNVTASFTCFVNGDSISCETTILVSCGPCADYVVQTILDECELQLIISQQSACAFTSTTVNYGDGTQVMGNNQFSFPHSYAQSGVYQIYVVSYCFDAEMNFVHSCSYLDSIEVKCDTIKEPLDDYCFFIHNSGYLDEVTALTKKGTSSIALAGTMHQRFYDSDKYVAILSPADILNEWQSPGSASPTPAGRIGGPSTSEIEYTDVGKSVLIKGRYMFTLGETSNMNSPLTDLIVTCYDMVNQTFVWSHYYDALGIEQGVKILDMVEERDHILIIGNTRPLSEGSWDVFALKLDLSGNVVASRIYHPTGDANQAEFASDAIKLIDESKYAVVGTRYWNGDSDMMAFKIDYDLNVISDFYFTGSGYKEIANGVTQVGDRLYMVGSIEKYYERDQIYIVELNAGNMAPTGVNAIYLSETSRIVGNKIIMDEDRNLIIAGFMQFGEEVSSRGVVLKVKWLPTSLTHLDLMWASMTSMDENAYFNDLTDYTSGFAVVGGAYQIESGDTDLFLVQVETKKGEACCLKPLNLAKKYEFKHFKFNPKQDTLAWKVDKYGDYTRDFVTTFICPEIRDSEIDYPVKSTELSMNFSVFPNPNRGSFTVRLGEASDQLRSIIIFDVSGRIVEQVKFDVNGEGLVLYDFDARHLQSGVYLLKVESAMGTKTTRVSVIH